jgi:ABC-type nickel/cobalt efflux system permease component RcnA
LLYRRAKALLDGGHHHHEEHHHEHSHHEHVHAEVRELVLAGHRHEHGHHHDHAHPHVHSHGGHTHSHTVEGKITLGSLIALGVSGGLVPCPSALILMLSSIALGRPGLGLLLLVGFSTGLAAVLMGIGFLVIYAKHLLPEPKAVVNRPMFRLIPVFSAVVVICLGFAMTAVSAGWVQPMRFL